MKNTSGLLVLMLSLLFVNGIAGQQIKSEKGYAPHIGVVVSMLDDLKESIGAMIYHLAATEKYYQLYTFEGRDFNSDERMWDLAQRLGTNARDNLVGNPISYYLDIWDEVRNETKRLLKTKDDDWFKSKVNGGRMNNHWAWYHVMEHQANHMGQIRLIIKRIN